MRPLATKNVRNAFTAAAVRGYPNDCDAAIIGEIIEDPMHLVRMVRM